MKKLLLALVAAMLAFTSTAATHYRDRIVPGGVCMVEFAGVTINASLIEEMRTGVMIVGYVQRPSFFGGYDPINSPALRVTLVNRQSYDLRTATVPEADMRKVAFLKLIEETCR